jgi:hypothetical protein
MTKEVTPNNEIVLPQEIGGVIPIVEFPQGLILRQTDFYFDPEDIVSGNPEMNKSKGNIILRDAFEITRTKRPNDFNGIKAALRQISVENNELTVTAGCTDYFTLWGLPQASPELHQSTISDIVRLKKTVNPLGISIHNILITQNGKVVVRVGSSTGAFSAGKISITHEEQMDPNIDINPFNTSVRGFYEEQGLLIPDGKTKLLGIAAEKNSAYTSFCFVGLTNKTEKEINEAWKKAPDYKETNSMDIIPIDKALNIPDKKGINLHPTVIWRLSLLKKYISTL